MPLGINGYNDTFKAFTDFATQAKSGSTIAQVGGEKNTVVGAGPLAGRTIVAKTGFDFIGNVGRRQASRDVNNDVRDLFKQAIADMFGGPDKIPESVRDAMKLSDFGKGRPLTARRIVAVKTAVDQAIDQKLNAGIEGGIKKMSPKRLPAARPLIETAFAACNRNADAIDIVSKNLTSKILYTATTDFRTKEDVQKRVESFIDNLDELKAAAKNNPGVYAAGRDMLLNLGKPLPKGMFTALAQAAGGIPVNNLRKLSGSTSGLEMHKTIMQFYESVQKAVVSAGAEKRLEGGDELMCVRSFMVEAVLSRCSQNTLGNIRDAIGSNATRNLIGFYGQCLSEEKALFQNETDDVKTAVDNVGTIGETYIRLLNEGVGANLQRLGRADERAEVPFADTVAMDPSAIDVDALVADTVVRANDAIDTNVVDCIDKTVVGGGKGADAFKAILRQKLEGSHDPAGKIGERLGVNANAMMNWNVCGEMKKLAAGEGGQFAKDIDRGTNATLSDGKTTVKLTQNFETARDELARFVTGDPDATYNGIRDNAVRNKVHLLMAVISQETEKATENGASYALDKREADDSFTISGFREKEKQAVRTYSIVKTDDGGISLRYVMDKPIADIDDGTTDGDGYPLGEGSKFTFKLDYTLNGTEFNRLANLDYGKFDDTAAYEIFNRKIDMPDGSRQFREHKLEKVVDSFPQEFKVNADCKMDFTMTLNPSDEDLFG